MDRRTWLWRRKSSEKSPSGETESSGSLSSHSERFSDDQNLSNPHNLSPEITSKSLVSDELSDGVKALSEKLSEALVNIRAKEDLVKQHAKVAEEAVSGWERAENEVVALRKLNDALNQKNLVLDSRVSQLDGALKECLKQLRQAREEQQEKIYEAVAKKSSEWESKKSQLEAAEKENTNLKLLLLSKEQELALRTNERDLSTQAAENASKLHLDGIKKMAKLEAECRKLKAVARKATSLFSESQSENGEDSSSVTSLKLGRTLGKSSIVPCVEIDLMDDFLEMEKLAAAPPPEKPSGTDQDIGTMELASAIMRTTELEEILKSLTSEKANLEIALHECQIQLKGSDDRLERTRERLVDLEMQLSVANEEKKRMHKELEDSKIMLEKFTDLLDETEMKMVRFQDQLAQVNAAKNSVHIQLEDANSKNSEADSLIKSLELELGNLNSTIFTLKDEVEKERTISREATEEREGFEAEISIMKSDHQSQTSAITEEFRTQLEDANLKKVEAEKQVSEMEIKLQTLHSSIFDMEKQFEKETQVSREAVAKCSNLEAEIRRMQQESESQKSIFFAEFRLDPEKEMEVAASKFAECQKTIASLGLQLKSLAAFDDFLMDSSEQHTVAVI